MERKYAWLFTNFQSKRKKMGMFVFQLNEENGKKEYVFFFANSKKKMNWKKIFVTCLLIFRKRKKIYMFVFQFKEENEKKEYVNVYFCQLL